MSATTIPLDVSGPYYEDLRVGQTFTEAPGLTLTEGLQALHQALLGDRLKLCLDRHLAQAVTGQPDPLAHPGLVWDVAIGQSTSATGRVIGNLFYRGLELRRWPRVNDTLRTVTEVVAMRDNAPRPHRAPTGLVVLRVITHDQHDRPVLDYHRCAMLPMRSEDARPGHRDDLDAISPELDAGRLLDSLQGLDLQLYRKTVPGHHAETIEAGQQYVVETGDTVTSAPELVRLSLNLARAHSDPTGNSAGRRLVYGGHTIGIALQHITRALPNLATILAWRSCDHLAPVFEGDILHSVVTVQDTQRVGAATTVEFQVQTSATRADGSQTLPVLDWRPVGALAT